MLYEIDILIKQAWTMHILKTKDTLEAHYEPHIFLPAPFDFAAPCLLQPLKKRLVFPGSNLLPPNHSFCCVIEAFRDKYLTRYLKGMLDKQFQIQDIGHECISLLGWGLCKK